MEPSLAGTDEQDHRIAAEAQALWGRVVADISAALDGATARAALQEVVPLAVERTRFVAGLPRQSFYLATHLQSFVNSSAIEDALGILTGRPLAFTLVEAGSLEEWMRGTNPAAGTEPAQPATNSGQSLQPSGASASQRAQREVAPTWEQLNLRLAQTAKGSPLLKFPHGQARLVMAGVRMISDTMDLMMPAPGQPSDNSMERALSKAIERLASAVALDPIFVSMELLRFRDSEGKDIGV